jgi:hypothetical protein
LGPLSPLTETALGIDEDVEVEEVQNASGEGQEGQVESSQGNASRADPTVTALVHDRLNHDLHAIIKHMVRQSRGDDYLVKHFMDCVAKDDEAWTYFWNRFRKDGTMTWKEFEKVVHRDMKWHGETEEVFHLLTENGENFITNGACLRMKRWWQKHRDILGHLGVDHVEEFKTQLKQMFGNLGKAWRLQLDPHNTGRCCFATYCRVCHTIGILRHLKHIWSQLTDGDTGRSICYRDLDPDGDMVIQQLATALAYHGGTLEAGWDQITMDAGASRHLYRTPFIDHCVRWGIETADAKWLFNVLDRTGAHFIESNDALEFLIFYDPGPLELDAAATQIGGGGKGPPRKGFASEEPFEIQVVLTPEEHDKFQEMLLNRKMIAGTENKIESRRIENVRRPSRLPGEPRKDAPLAVGWTTHKEDAKTTPKHWIQSGAGDSKRKGAVPNRKGRMINYS